MKQNRGRSYAVSGLLIAVLLLVLLLNSMVFIQGPYLKEKELFYQAHYKVMKEMRAKQGELINRYALNEITYISRIHSLSKDWIVWYDEEGKIRDQIVFDDIQRDKAAGIAHEMGISNDKLDYGWIDNRPALLFEDKNREILLDAKTLEVLLDFEKR